MMDPHREISPPKDKIFAYFQKIMEIAAEHQKQIYELTKQVDQLTVRLKQLEVQANIARVIDEYHS